MRYLLDSNVLIDANRDYYPRERVPEFWNWLLHQARNEIVKIPYEMYNEIIRGNDALVEWVKDQKDILVLSEEVKLERVREVVSQGYAPDLNESELVQVGHDPFIIAYALDLEVESTVVTTEVSKPRRKRGKRHLPDVCKDFDVKCINTFELLRELDFRTDNWKPK